MDQQPLVPSNKEDVETASRLKDHTFEELKPFIPQLLSWIQNMNWPVAAPVADYLLTVSPSITSEIIEVLKGNNDVWKYSCLHVFGYQETIDPLLLEEIKRIATYPTAGEIETGAEEEAHAIIEKAASC
jgi:hypothetical protein